MSLGIGLPELQFIWFSVFVTLLAGYAILDGFDLGVGILHLFTNTDHERRVFLNSIGPVWDGNEVWLVTAGGALFAGFPSVYASFCSAFYIPLMVLLAGIIFRAVAIEFRSKMPSPTWRWTWDVAFFCGSVIITFGLGVVMGNLIRGIPLDAEGEFLGGLSDLLNPYALLVGVMTVALFAMHGAIYLTMKTEGALHDKLREWINPTIITFIMLYAITTVATLIYQPHMTKAIHERPIFFVSAIVGMLAIANIPREVYRGRDGYAFLSSCLAIIFLFVLFGLGTYPIALRASNDVALSLTIFNSSSSEMTLQILLLIAVIGIPLVVAYTVSIYWIFRGKVRLEDTSY
ncbi:MAG: cytochrome d ubiquinol oxidase subunit II [Chlamydiales bacterium]|nr:cytochrome d ubiquinol oxidase subunit II [Chlamydiales bacterium]